VNDKKGIMNITDSLLTDSITEVSIGLLNGIKARINTINQTTAIAPIIRYSTKRSVVFKVTPLFFPISLTSREC
jgi:hypothetical protein